MNSASYFIRVQTVFASFITILAILASGWIQAEEIIPISTPAPITNTLKIAALDPSRCYRDPKTGQSWAFSGPFFATARSLLLNSSLFGPSGRVPVSFSISQDIVEITSTTLQGIDIFFLAPLDWRSLAGAEIRQVESFVEQGHALLEMRFNSGRPDYLGITGGPDFVNGDYCYLTSQGAVSPLANGPFGVIQGRVTFGANTDYSNLGQAIPITTNSAGPNLLMLDPDQGFSGRGHAVFVGGDEFFMNHYMEVNQNNQTCFLNTFAFLARPPAPPPPPFAVSDLSPAGYSVDVLQAGKNPYSDRGYKFAGPIPSDLLNQIYIKTLNDDKDSPSFSLRFRVNQPALAVVALDDRLNPPAWMQGWKRRSDPLLTTDPNPKRVLFEKWFDAGEIALGPNRERGGALGYSMYSVVILPHKNGVKGWQGYQ